MKIVAFLAVVLAGMFLSGCASAAEEKTASPARAEYVRITPEKAHAMLGENQELILVDVRTPEEYAEKHIPGAKLIPNESIQKEPIEGLAKDAVILVYCRTGHRSQQAANKLLDMGYEHVYDIEGGITHWPYETEAGAAK